LMTLVSPPKMKHCLQAQSRSEILSTWVAMFTTTTLISAMFCLTAAKKRELVAIVAALGSTVLAATILVFHHGAFTFAVILAVGLVWYALCIWLRGVAEERRRWSMTLVQIVNEARMRRTLKYVVDSPTIRLLSRGSTILYIAAIATYVHHNIMGR
jgi:hypothetical protein